MIYVPDKYLKKFKNSTVYVLYVDMTRENYVGVSIPKDLMDEIDTIIRDTKHGFKSRAEFFKEAARLKLKDYKD